ncbi:hypothetical protein [Aquabacter spiritensis]|uniref:Uncharacterized protein n=1 Tax=Aquabacter spiritensis TaxID=933073 RepID=A0A4R3LNH7_9HYPH|nr:hypothetical protein [Aquabacter spiritensis]TCT01701.1 hypothetical protein EDC64_11754 [Aquabacter spiritensis]
MPDRLLSEDPPPGDLATRFPGIGGTAARMVFRIRHPAVVSAACAVACAGTGARILVTSAPYRAKPADVKLEIASA